MQTRVFRALASVNPDFGLQTVIQGNAGGRRASHITLHDYGLKSEHRWQT